MKGAAGAALLIIILTALEATPSAGGQSVAPESCVDAPNNPVLNDSAGYTYKTSTGTWFAYNNTHQEPSVMKVGGGFRMWYAGNVGGGVLGIYTASSKDGANWTVDQAPVVTGGPNGSIYGPSVLYNGTAYLMYFTGNNGTTPHDRYIGLALSADGVRWHVYPGNPVLVAGPGVYDSGWVKNANAIYRNGAYEMWYVGSSFPNKTASGYLLYQAIDLATSLDGIHWTKYAGNPVFLGAPDQIVDKTTVVGHPDILNINGTLLMLYGDGYSIRYATSYDGTDWRPMPGDLVNSNRGFWKSSYVSEPAALLNGTQLNLWYFGASPIANQSSSYIAGIGLAYCNLVLLQISTTTTVVTTSTNTITSLTSTTTTQMVTTVRTEEIASPALGYYQVALGGLAVAVAALLALVLQRRR